MNALVSGEKSVRVAVRPVLFCSEHVSNYNKLVPCKRNTTSNRPCVDANMTVHVGRGGYPPPNQARVTAETAASHFGTMEQVTVCVHCLYDVVLRVSCRVCVCVMCVCPTRPLTQFTFFTHKLDRTCSTYVLGKYMSIARIPTLLGRAAPALAAWSSLRIRGT